MAAPAAGWPNMDPNGDPAAGCAGAPNSDADEAAPKRDADDAGGPNREPPPIAAPVPNSDADDCGLNRDAPVLPKRPPPAGVAGFWPKAPAPVLPNRPPLAAPPNRGELLCCPKREDEAGVPNKLLELAWPNRPTPGWTGCCPTGVAPVAPNPVGLMGVPNGAAPAGWLNKDVEDAAGAANNDCDDCAGAPNKPGEGCAGAPNSPVAAGFWPKVPAC